MTNHSPAQKSFVKSGDEATIVCPQCGSTKILSVRQFRQRLHMLEAKCRCGYAFKVQLEFRHHYRKATDLPGTYEPLPPAVAGGNGQSHQSFSQRRMF